MSDTLHAWFSQQYVDHFGECAIYVVDGRERRVTGVTTGLDHGYRWRDLRYVGVTTSDSYRGHQKANRRPLFAFRTMMQIMDDRESGHDYTAQRLHGALDCARELMAELRQAGRDLEADAIEVLLEPYG